MSDPRNSFPGTFDGLKTWSGNPPTSKLSADGLVFYGMNVKDNTGLLWYIVYSIDANDNKVQRLKLGPGASPGAGQGMLDIDAGWLIVTGFRQAGDGQPSDRVPVPGWSRWPTPDALINALQAQVTALQQQVADLEKIVVQLDSGTWLSEEDRAALAWVQEVRALP